ncbi:hypothetical protein GBA52_017963 [Prunus armeniaca]|nr:hypothetical protein GBA52_017963 [Prunus armeniaca]
MPIIQSTCLSNVLPIPNSAVPLPPYSLSCSTLSSRASAFFTRNSNPIFKSNYAPFLRTKPPRGARLVIQAAGTDYYKTLNVPRSATLQEIKSSYRKLARKQSCRSYQMMRKGLYMIALVKQVYRENMILRPWVQQGYDLYLSFEESIFGVQREIEVSSVETCDNCGGTGAKSDNCIKSCTGCGGRGGVMKTQRTPFGMISQVSTCSKCGGDGRIITDPCQRCSGKGQVQSKRPMSVTIPAGVNDGATMQIQGEGNFDKKRGTVGDVFIVLHIDRKAGIHRDGLNLYSKIKIDYTEAILGTVIKGEAKWYLCDLKSLYKLYDMETVNYLQVETVEGLKELQIPSGIQPVIRNAYLLKSWLHLRHLEKVIQLLPKARV